MNSNSLYAYARFMKISHSDTCYSFSLSSICVDAVWSHFMKYNHAACNWAISSGIVISSSFFIWPNLFPSECNGSMFVIAAIAKHLFYSRIWDHVNSVSDECSVVRASNTKMNWILWLKQLTRFISVVLVGNMPLAMLTNINKTQH